MGRRLIAIVAATVTVAVTAAGLAGTAAAASTEAKLATLASWTDTTVSSYDAWNSARTHQDTWADYHFDWSTDYCSSSPDNPLGFDFRLSCYRHDFGYRNYRDMSLFSQHKDRLDNAFYQDLQRRCDTYSVALRPACDSLAWAYYEAVHIFGSARVSEADLDRARSLLPETPEDNS